MTIVPDTKNWTWVLGEACPECGFEAGAIDVNRMPSLVRDNVAAWPPLLAAANVGDRPSDSQWSALEYGCHIRDVFRVFHERLGMMLTEDAPRFENWDQDATAIAQRYHEQDPAAVADELVIAGEACARGWEQVGEDAWQRTGHRSDGSTFTIESFARYFLHDPVHHLVDVANGNRRLGAC